MKYRNFYFAKVFEFVQDSVYNVIVFAEDEREAVIACQLAHPEIDFDNNNSDDTTLGEYVYYGFMTDETSARQAAYIASVITKTGDEKLISALDSFTEGMQNEAWDYTFLNIVQRVPYVTERIPEYFLTLVRANHLYGIVKNAVVNVIMNRMETSNWRIQANTTQIAEEIAVRLHGEILNYRQHLNSIKDYAEVLAHAIANAEDYPLTESKPDEE